MLEYPLALIVYSGAGSKSSVVALIMKSPTKRKNQISIFFNGDELNKNSMDKTNKRIWY